MNRIAQLLLYTLLPLAGILFFSWDWRQVILLYWLENITIGLQTFVGLYAAPKDTPLNNPSGLVRSSNMYVGNKKIDLSVAGANYVMAWFFALHYGLFTLVHGFFVFALINGVFSGDTMTTTTLVDERTAASSFGILFVCWITTTILQLAMLRRQTNFVASTPQQSLSMMMIAPYKRIVVLHLAIIGGALLISALQLPSAAATLLIVIRFLIDFVPIVRRKSSPTVL